MTPELLKKCMPKASASNCTLAAPHFKDAMLHYGITTKDDTAAFFANVQHESGSLLFVHEGGGRDYLNKMYDTRTDLGNTPAKDGDGATWAGHGYIQVTGHDNHMAAAKEFGKKPEEIAAWLQTPAGAAWSACWFWASHGLSAIANKPEMWRGNRGTKFKGLDKFTYCCVTVNGGLNGIDERRKNYAFIKKVLASA